jgi:intracellular multiplication protein IcmP
MADGKQEGGTENFLSWVIILIIAAICIYLVYLKFTPEVNGALRWVRYAQLWVISLFTPDSFSITLPSGQEMNVKEWLSILPNIPAENVDSRLLSAIGAMAMQPIKWIVAFIIGLIGIWAYFRGPGTQYKKVFDLDSFIEFQAKNFPVIAPFINYNPAKQEPRPPGSDVPAELPPFAEALGPEEWIAYHEIKIKDNVIDKNSAFKAFTRQLGPRWKGAKNLAPYKQILLAACCLKASRKRDEADDMLGRLALCWSIEKGLRLNTDRSLLSNARKILKDKDIAHPTLKKCNQHAWQTTALLRALLNARNEGGVLAPAQFVWLRAHDRELWYPLNNLGRQSNHTEAIGAMAHFKSEKRIGRPIPKPKVQDAVTSIVEYMNSSNARPVPALDYSMAKNKSGIKKMKQTQ